jgi:hypothetical protein
LSIARGLERRHFEPLQGFAMTQLIATTFTVAIIVLLALAAFVARLAERLLQPST